MRLKLKPKSVKGYLQIDIAFAILVFFIIFITVFTLNKDNISEKNNFLTVKEIEMNARDICTILISSPGVPDNWENLNNINDAKVFGLINKSSSSISSGKIEHFNTTNYFVIKNNFDEKSYFNLRIVGLNTSMTYLDFGTSLKGKNVKSSSYNCYAIYNSEPVRLVVEVWK